VSSRDQIPKLEALLARVKQRAELPRPVAAPPVVAAAPPVQIKINETVPPTSDGRVALELESRTRVVETTVEIDEADIIPASQEPPPVEIEIGEPDVEAPPPSSKRPIPMEAIAEAQKHEPPPPPPPESGKLVAAAADGGVPSFDDDFTGVREASNLLPPLEPDAPSIEVQHIEPPKPAPVHEMEAELGAPPPAASESRRISDVAPAVAHATGTIEPEITNASLPKAAAVQVHGTVQAFKPQSFGELVDATLGL
jgi:hypothetical protein